MIGITLVGNGFLGSLVAVELAKLFFAMNTRCHWVLYDPKRFESRNAANQFGTPVDAALDRYKVTVTAALLQQYDVEAPVWAYPELFTGIHDAHFENAIYDGFTPTLFIDCTDNLAARKTVWVAGRQLGLPVLHCGIARNGTGEVGWSSAPNESFSLSPLRLAASGYVPADVPSGDLKPCELYPFRGGGLNIAIAASKAVGVWLGLDPWELEPVGTLLPKRVMHSYLTTLQGHTLHHRAEV